MPDTSITLTIGTDVAHLLIYHPDDLKHTEGWPLGWYAEPACFQSESAAGRLIAWCTGSDGGFKVRLTTEPLSFREEQYVRQSWAFRYTGTKGRVFIDNSDGLWGESRMDDPFAQDLGWLDLDPDYYNVTVYAIEWNAEPGSDAENFETLPNYTVVFRRRASATAPPIARCPPTLTGENGQTATDEVAVYTPRPVVLSEAANFADVIAGFASNSVLPPGDAFQARGDIVLEPMLEDPDRSSGLFDIPFIVAPKLEAGAIGVLCSLHQAAFSPKENRADYGFRSLGLVRITAVDGAWTRPQPKAPEKRGAFSFHAKAPKPQPIAGLYRLRAEPLVAASPPASESLLNGFRSRIVSALAPDQAFAKRVGTSANYHALTLAGPSSEAVLSSFLFRHLPLTPAARLKIAALPVVDRVRALSEELMTL